MDRFGSRTLDDALGAVAVSGTDPAPVVEYVEGVLRAKRRRTRLVAASAVVFVMALFGGALTLTGGEDPAEVVSASPDRDEADSRSKDSEGSTAESGSVVTVVPTRVRIANDIQPVDRHAFAKVGRSQQPIDDLFVCAG
jgi:hypothetical protein